MTSENVEVILKAVDAVNRRDVDGFIAGAHAEIEFDDSEGFAGVRQVYRGPAEVRAWFEEVFLEAWESVHMEVEEVLEASDQRVFLGTSMTGRGRASGAEAAIRFWTLYWFADGMVIRRQLYWTREEALEAAGLSR